MARLWADNAVATLANSATSGDATLTLSAGYGTLFPSPSGGDYFVVTLTQAGSTETSWEKVQVTSRSGDILTVVRGYESSTASAWAAGSKCELRITKGLFTDISSSGTFKHSGQALIGAGATPWVASQALHTHANLTGTTAHEYGVVANINAGSTSGAYSRTALVGNVVTMTGYAATGSNTGVAGMAQHNTTGTAVLYGVSGYCSNTSTGTASTAVNFQATGAGNTGGGTITQWVGFNAANNTSGANNYGFVGGLSAGAGKYNFYASGDALNYFAGNVVANAAFNQTPTRSTVASGSTVVLTTATNNLLYDNAATAAALTVTLPSASLTDGQTISIATRSAITALTVDGGTIYGAPSTLAAGGSCAFIYSSAGAAWFRKG